MHARIKLRQLQVFICSHSSRVQRRTYLTKRMVIAAGEVARTVNDENEMGGCFHQGLQASQHAYPLGSTCFGKLVPRIALAGG